MSNLSSGWVEDPADVLRVRAGRLLADDRTDATPGFEGGKSDAEATLAEGAERLNLLQERLYAASTVGDRRSILLVLQAMDTAGKGGIVGHVISAVNPDGIKYRAFKKPTREELAHDFLWRVDRELPKVGQIGVFDRSHYEDVLIGRVRSLVDAEEIERRYGAINDFEERLVDNGTTIVKVMLHISSDEQKKRLTARLHDPTKYWKYNPADVDERLLWDDYQEAYQLVFDRTSTEWAPWHIVPADKKWYARIAVQRLLIHALEDMDLDWPAPDYDLEVERKRVIES